MGSAQVHTADAYGSWVSPACMRCCVPCIDRRPKLPGPLWPPRCCQLRSAANAPQDDIHGCPAGIEASYISLTHSSFYGTDREAIKGQLGLRAYAAAESIVCASAGHHSRCHWRPPAIRLVSPRDKRRPSFLQPSDLRLRHDPELQENEWPAIRPRGDRRCGLPERGGSLGYRIQSFTDYQRWARGNHDSVSHHYTVVFDEAVTKR